MSYVEAWLNEAASHTTSEETRRMHEILNLVCCFDAPELTLNESLEVCLRYSQYETAPKINSISIPACRQQPREPFWPAVCSVAVTARMSHHVRTAGTNSRRRGAQNHACAAASPALAQQLRAERGSARLRSAREPRELLKLRQAEAACWRSRGSPPAPRCRGRPPVSMPPAVRFLSCRDGRAAATISRSFSSFRRPAEPSRRSRRRPETQGAAGRAARACHAHLQARARARPTRRRPPTASFAHTPRHQRCAPQPRAALLLNVPLMARRV